MALKTLIKKKELSDLKKSLEDLRSKQAEFEKREEELAADIEAAVTDEEKNAVTSAVEEFEKEKEETEAQSSKLEEEISKLESELKEEETKQEESRKAAKAPEIRKDESNMRPGTKFFGMTYEERDRFFKDSKTVEFLARVRSFKDETRAVSGADLLIPTNFLGIIRENIENYSKLIGKVFKRQVKGEGRITIPGTIPEAVWTEMCANLNELAVRFMQTEFDGFKVGGYIVICNATLDDADDLNLATEIINSLGAAIGLALDKAIVYGTGTKMPLGITTRLAQQSKPDGYSTKDRPWQDLHTSNIVTIPQTSKALTLFQDIITASTNSSSKYSRGTKTWLMNNKTKELLGVQAMSFNANGAIVSGVNGTMPVSGGEIITLEFIPDNEMAVGYLENYGLVERAAVEMAKSTEVKFFEDQTAFKATARYDGKPVIAEAFTWIGLNGVTPGTTPVEFPTDTAN